MRVTQRQLREGEPTIDEMRHDLAERDAVGLNRCLWNWIRQHKEIVDEQL